MAESEPALPLGATFVGVTQTNHHTGRRAGPWTLLVVVHISVMYCSCSLGMLSFFAADAASIAALQLRRAAFHRHLVAFSVAMDGVRCRRCKLYTHMLCSLPHMPIPMCRAAGELTLVAVTGEPALCTWPDQLPNCNDRLLSIRHPQTGYVFTQTCITYMQACSCTHAAAIAPTSTHQPALTY